MRAGCIDPLLNRPLQFLSDQRENVAGGVLSDENVQMAISLKQSKRMVIPAPGIEEGECAALALRQEATIIQAGKKSDARIGARLLRDKIRRQFRTAFNRYQVAFFYTPAHLGKELDGHLSEFLPDPFMRGIIQILVTP